MPQIDPLTGNDYESEKRMYMRYHGLTEEQAVLALQALTHKERDEVFYSFSPWFLPGDVK